MKVCAVICELNPFHNGHEYLFREARRLTGADFLIAVMSGDFVQRGLPAICDKYARTAMALNGGADLVIELPVTFATASADYFAQGAISAITSMGCVNFIVFGSECGDLDMLRSCAGLSEESDPGLHILSQGEKSEKTRNYKISQLLKEGMSYAKAYATVTGNEFASNDMLAIRYLKSLDMMESDIEAVCVRRTGGSYLDSSDGALSAMSVRKKMFAHEGFTHLVPKYTYRTLEKIASKAFPVSPDDFSIQLHTVISRLLSETPETEGVLTEYMDVSANIEGRIRSNIGGYSGYESFVSLVHSKEYTKSRVMRALLHILLGIKKEDYPFELSECCVSYIRILGFRRSASALLSSLKENCVVPVISKAADASSILDDEALHMFELDINAANLYDMACTFRFGKSHEHDCAREVVIL